MAAVLSLALGMGSCVAAFRLIDALLWRPLPISPSGNLYVLSRKMTGFDGKPVEDGHWATPDFNLMRDAAKDQADLIAISDADRTDIAYTTDDDIEKAHVAYVSGNMFPAFGLEPALGRMLAPADDGAPGVAPYAVLSWDYWNHRFGHDPHVLGRSLHIGDQEIDGKSGPRVVDFATFVIHTNAQNRLALADSLRQLITQRHNGLRISNITTQLDLVRDQTIRDRLIAMLAAFFASIALLLAGIGLYAVLNYSVLQRRREIGIRIAIGSNRAGIVRIVTLDVYLIITLGGCVGVALGFGAARYVESLFYQVKATDADMIAWPTCAMLLSALVATMPAVLRALRTDPTEILRSQ